MTDDPQELVYPRADLGHASGPRQQQRVVGQKGERPLRFVLPQPPREQHVGPPQDVAGRTGSGRHHDGLEKTDPTDPDVRLDVPLDREAQFRPEQTREPVERVVRAESVAPEPVPLGEGERALDPHEALPLGLRAERDDDPVVMHPREDVGRARAARHRRSAVEEAERFSRAAVAHAGCERRQCARLDAEVPQSRGGLLRFLGPHGGGRVVSSCHRPAGEPVVRERRRPCVGNLRHELERRAGELESTGRVAREPPRPACHLHECDAALQVLRAAGQQRERVLGRGARLWEVEEEVRTGQPFVQIRARVAARVDGALEVRDGLGRGVHGEGRVRRGLVGLRRARAIAA